MRDAVKKLGGDPENINPICPADLVIDHSVQVEFSRTLVYGRPRSSLICDYFLLSLFPCFLSALFFGYFFI